MDYVKVTARGLDEVAEGRVFVISGGIELAPPDFTLTTPVDTVEPVSDASDMVCSLCGVGLKRFLIGHNWQWMYTVFGCSEHPKAAAYLDVFPKVDGGTEHDWVNSFMGLETGQEQFIGIVQGMTWPEESREQWLKRAQSEAELTPAGLTFVKAPRRSRFPWIFGNP